MARITRLLISPPWCSAATLRGAVQGRCVWVTGASRGVGLAAARRLAGCGAKVVMLARSTDALEAEANALRRQGHAAHAVYLDLAQPALVPEQVAGALRQFPPDALISNAGKSVRRPVLEGAARRDLARQLAVNLSGPAELVVALLPHLLERRGHIVNVSSVSAFPPAAPRFAGYQGSKAGFDLWLHSVGNEWAAPSPQGAGLRVSSVYLPLVRTAMSAPTVHYRRQPALTAKEAAASVCAALAHPRRRLAPWWLGLQVGAAWLWPEAVGNALARAEARERG